jgi:hypothetical protein
MATFPQGLAAGIDFAPGIWRRGQGFEPSMRILPAYREDRT